MIVDLRGNGGGNERWPIEWIRRLTGERAESVFIFSELNSRTTIAGRANALARWREQSPGSDYLQQQEFVPEDSRHLRRKVIIVCLLSLLGCIWAFLARRRSAWLIVPGTIWLVIGAAWILIGRSKGQPLTVDAGAGFLALGLVLISGGLLLWFRATR